MYIINQQQQITKSHIKTILSILKKELIIIIKYNKIKIMLRRLLKPLIRYTNSTINNNNNNNNNISKQDKILREYDQKITQLRKQSQLQSQSQTQVQTNSNDTNIDNNNQSSTSPSTAQQTRKHRHRHSNKISQNDIDKNDKQQKIAKIVNQTRKKLKQAQQQNDLSKIKSYLMEGLQTNNNNNYQQQNSDKSYIPNNMVLKKLKFLNKKILLIGVQQQNQDHCIYLKQIAQKMQTNVILTALPPDMPYFIKTQQSYIQQWQKFVSNINYTKQSKFYINPTPKSIQQFSLNKQQIQLIRASMSKSVQFNQIFYTIMQKSQKNNKFIPNALLTPFLINTVQKIYICDYPLLKQREFWALNVGVQRLRELFQIYHRELYKYGENQKDKIIFDPRILFPKEVIQRKFQYMANAIKYVSCTSQRPVIYVCPAQYSEMLCEQFRKDKPVSQYTNFKQNIIPSSSSSSSLQKTPFLQYVQKLVIMDLILQPILHKYFIKNISFPFTAKQTLGGRENIGKIFIVWRHFYNMYMDVLRKQPTSMMGKAGRSTVQQQGQGQGIKVGQNQGNFMGANRVNRQGDGSAVHKLKNVFEQ